MAARKGGEMNMSKSQDFAPKATDQTNNNKSQVTTGELAKMNLQNARVIQLQAKAHKLYSMGSYKEALECCELAYEADAYRTDNLLLLGAIHFQLRNFSESIFYNQQCIRVDPNFAEGYSNLGNALKELGDVEASVQFYLKVHYYRLLPSTYLINQFPL